LKVMRTSYRIGIGLIVIVGALFAARVAADEGMWTLNRFPAAALQKKYNFTPTRQWLDQAQLASVRLPGCSGSIVSPSGLVMTNYHCAVGCVESLSTNERNLLETGFYAASAAEERICPGVQINQLTAITDVTDRVGAATKGAGGEAFAKARQGAFATIQRECATSDDVTCEVVSLYQGGKYDLYKYKRFSDVRLVFAPEFETAFFGGDPDNFMFPRYNLDLAFMRLYEGGTPLRAAHRFAWSPAGTSPGDLVFVTGHPGTTLRQYTAAQLEFERDVRLVTDLTYYSERRGLLMEFRRRGAEQARVAAPALITVENTLKVFRGQSSALADPALLERKRADEAALRRQIAARPELAKRFGGAWDAIAKAVRGKRDPWLRAAAFNRLTASQLLGQALTLVRLPAEQAKPNGDRLPEYTESALPARRQQVAAQRPYNKEMDTVFLTHVLTHLREQLGLDDPAVKALLGRRSPEEVAASAIGGTRLDDASVRTELMKGGASAIDVSTDPLIALAKAVDPFARAARRQLEDGIDSIIDRNLELVAQARFAVLGETVYPDATFTLRVSYGTIKGWREGNHDVRPFTTLGGLYERVTGSEPFVLPERWMERKASVALDTPFNLSADTDIIGGNSGSPMIDRAGRIVGLVFDGNIHSIGGEYWFDETKNRTVAVDSRGIREALKSIYQADRILAELDAP
jgi:hypothetical protein